MGNIDNAPRQIVSDLITLYLRHPRDQKNNFFIDTLKFSKNRKISHQIIRNNF